ncbi:MAG TPA: ABC transporter permease [Thermomicrobiales bacterium]|nr:ABC transporter permease [Thermomicrobiales bacterium]
MSSPRALDQQHDAEARSPVQVEPQTGRVVVGRGPRRSRARRLGYLPSLVVGLIALAAWQIATATDMVAPYLLPAPAAVAESLWSALTNGVLWRYTRVTLIESMAGFALGSLFALPMGYGIARSRLFARTMEPYLAASQAMPAVALAPLLVLWMGYGIKPIAVLCALIVFFPMVVNTALGIRLLDRDILEAARIDGASWWPLLIHFEVPLAGPALRTGLRSSLTLSITGAVVGEFVLGDRGLGGLLTVARGNFDTPLVFATIFTLMLLAACMYGIAWVVERRVSYLYR